MSNVYILTNWNSGIVLKYNYVFLDPVRLQHRDTLEVWFFFPYMRNVRNAFWEKKGKTMLEIVQMD